METINLKIPKIPNDPNPINISLKDGDQVFIVGPNGSGKSALIQHFFASLPSDRVKWIPAHRQLWSRSGRLDLTPASRQEYEDQMLNHNRNLQARYKDHNAYQRQAVSAILFDLVNKENTRARSIAYHVDNDDSSEARKISAESPPPFDQLNGLLNLATLTVNIENSHNQEILARHSQDAPFNVIEMSDGERSAMIIGAHVITAEPGTVFLIDEPERHLHRSISQPFLSALFDLRKDCAFIISTHELDLAIANSEARVLMLRSCQWSGDICVAWDAEVIEPNFQLPEKLRLTEETKRAILGSRKRILFVEGDSNSLDTQLYDVLFPNLTVIPKGRCEDVINAVLGLRKSQEFHDVEAFGLIDRDNREPGEIDKLAESRIFALEVYSVEALYYYSEVIATVAHQQVEFLGKGDPNELVELVHQKVIEVLKNPQLAKRMAARRCERQVHNLFWSNVPNWRSIMDNSTQSICVPIDPHLYSKELEHFNTLVDKGEIDSLIARYPLRESPVFETIVQTLECESQKFYERTVVKLVQDDEKVANCIKKRISQFSDALNKIDKPETTQNCCT